MTRRDYETIATCISRERVAAGPYSAERRAVLASLTNRLALEFKIDNPRFDVDRFYAACEREPS